MSDNLWIDETYIIITDVDERTGYEAGYAEPYETFTDNKSRLFLSLQREYGRCTGAQYVERKDGSSVKCGWVFEKHGQLAETWITVWKAPPEKVPSHWTGGVYA